MIYLVKCGEFHKIGYTSGRKADDRIKSMQTGNPYPLDLAGLWHGTENDEAALHVYYAHRKVRGEWFALTDDDVARIREIMEARPPTVELPPPPRANPPSPKCLPDLQFPEGINVVVDGVFCTWCALPMSFVGTIEYLVCNACGLKSPMQRILVANDRRVAVERTMRRHCV